MVAILVRAAEVLGHAGARNSGPQREKGLETHIEVDRAVSLDDLRTRAVVAWMEANPDFDGYIDGSNSFLECDFMVLHPQKPLRDYCEYPRGDLGRMVVNCLCDNDYFKVVSTPGGTKHLVAIYCNQFEARRPAELDKRTLQVAKALQRGGEHPLRMTIHTPDIPPGEVREGTGKRIGVEIKTLTGKTIPIAIREDDLVYTLKIRIQDAEGIPPDQQRLVFAGMQFEDGIRVCDYGVTDGSVLHLVLRLRGGMMHESSGMAGYEPAAEVRGEIEVEVEGERRRAVVSNWDSVSRVIEVFSAGAGGAAPGPPGASAQGGGQSVAEQRAAAQARAVALARELAEAEAELERLGPE